MKVLTIKEPYATLIKEGIKKYEFRTWKTNYRGDFLIHAGKSRDKNNIIKYKDYNLDYSCGEIICIANLKDCIKVDDNFREKLRKENPIVYEHVINDKTWNGYAFVLDNIRVIDKIKVNGKLSFWEYDYE
jgi:hypothetical protein